jgi:putative transcriptional regulator
MTISPPPRRPLRRRLVSAGLLANAAALVAGARPPAGAMVQAGPPVQTNSLAGQLLVATSEMGDARFFHTVIVVVQHDQRGALGIIVNRPLGVRPLAVLLEALGDKSSPASGQVRVFAGGPVEPGVGFILHSAEYSRHGTIAIDGRLAMTSSVEVLRDLGQGRGPQRSLIAFGYAGWRPGQLEDEMTQRAWFTIPEDPAMVFDDDRAKLWDEATKKRTFPL